MSNYPEGALDDSDAPYNQKEDKIKLNVLVSLTISKNFIINVDRDYDESLLTDIVNNTIFFPHEIIQSERKFLETNYSSQELDKWTINELDVIKDE